MNKSNDAAMFLPNMPHRTWRLILTLVRPVYFACKRLTRFPGTTAPLTSRERCRFSKLRGHSSRVQMVSDSQDAVLSSAENRSSKHRLSASEFYQCNR